MKQILISAIFIALLIGGYFVTTQIISKTATQPSRGVGGISQDDPNASSNPQLALVIGNSQYDYSPLANPMNDATDMARVLEQIGFEVILKTDLNQRALDDAIDDFGRRLLNRQGVGLFYFAGHGAQVNGQNYLLPVDNTRIKDERDLKYHAVDADKILERMEVAQNNVNIMVLDACRDNPYQGSKRGGTQRGLAYMQSPSGSIIAFATDKGKTAADTSMGGRNGLFTKHLLDVLKTAPQQHQRIDDMFMQVRNAVIQESGGTQEPWYSASLKEPFCFGGCQTGTTVAVPTPLPPTPPEQDISVSETTTPVQPAPMPSPSSQESTPPSHYRFIDNGDGTVTDKWSGLIWLKNANCYGTQTWEDAIQLVSNLAPIQCGLRDGSSRGDWRLATKEEWEAFVDKRYANPVLSNAEVTGQWTEGDAFLGVQTNNWYWSANENTSRNTSWCLHFGEGEVRLLFNTDNLFYVWPVRNGQ
jgi:hypothetical protein